MARSYILPMVFVITGLVFASHAFAANESTTPSFTIMSYLPVEDFMTLYCQCVDVAGDVTTVGSQIISCVDKEFPAALCPSGAAASTYFCNMKYYSRDRTKAPVIITPYYTNIQVWTSTGPPKTYYQITPNGVYGSTQVQYFTPTDANKICAWSGLFEGFPRVLLKDPSVGNGKSF